MYIGYTVSYMFLYIHVHVGICMNTYRIHHSLDVKFKLHSSSIQNTNTPFVVS